MSVSRLRQLILIAGAVYLVWWFGVELLLPTSFNPLPGRLLVVGTSGALVAASHRSRWVESNLPGLFTAWLCLLVGHYTYLLIGNHGDPTWWMGSFVTVVATGMCAQSVRDIAVFSVFALGCVGYAAAVLGQLQSSIYVPGLATMLLLANITKRSQIVAQTALVQATLARRETERADDQRLQLAAIVESSADAIIASSLDGVIGSWNRAAEQLFGYAAGEVVGQPVSILLPPGVEGEERGLIERLSRGESAAPFETKRRRKDGTMVDVSVTLSAIRGSGDDLVGVSLAARDISDRRRAEAAVLRARDLAEAANRELEAFSYSVAHDLRAPLRGINGFSQALLEDHVAALDDEGKDYLRRVRDSADEMGRLIDGLLSLARLSRIDVRTSRIDLSELARAAVARAREFEPDRSVEATIEDGLTDRGDGTLLGVVIANLVTNAWKFTRNQPRARVEFGSSQRDGRTVYFVRDNGAGFDMAYAAKLFGVFQRLHKQSEFEGTGVGLATVQRIVRRHGGRVWAEGKVGDGACFYFTLSGGS